MNTSETHRGQIFSLVPEAYFGTLRHGADQAEVFFHGHHINAPFRKLCIGQSVAFKLGWNAEVERHFAFDILVNP